ncbi:TMEM164 family acyltransferase, partial [Bacillus velezensis]
MLFPKNLNHPPSNPLFPYLLFILLPLSHIPYHISLLSHHPCSLKTPLPLQLTDLSLYFAMLMLVTKSKKLFPFL